MNYLEYELGRREEGEIVEIELSGDAANVMLVDRSNRDKYRDGREFQYLGGHATKSPVRLGIPYHGDWWVIVDHGGYDANTNVSVRVLPGALPEIGC